jgi:hypothetical protein
MEPATFALYSFNSPALHPRPLQVYQTDEGIFGKTKRELSAVNVDSSILLNEAWADWQIMLRQDHT